MYTLEETGFDNKQDIVILGNESCQQEVTK